MRILSLSLAAYGAAVLFSLSAWGPADAQPTSLPLSQAARTQGDIRSPPDPLMASDASLSQREARMGLRLRTALADGVLDQARYDRATLDLADIAGQEDEMRARHQGELTDQDTFDLEGRLKALAASLP